MLNCHAFVKRLCQVGSEADVLSLGRLLREIVGQSQLYRGEVGV